MICPHLVTIWRTIDTSLFNHEVNTSRQRTESYVGCNARLHSSHSSPAFIAPSRACSRRRGAWLLNIGQVYQTMQRLERDGCGCVSRQTNAGRDPEVFELTDVQVAMSSPPGGPPSVPREHLSDELVMKLVAAAN